ncbi:MAG: hypothetical protein LBK94_09400 [Prevotellaceae bacterium]|jgi:YD repeat-containing protein|nr:hypothetical protein [Prevotellaceae bacterium]
MKKQLSKTLFFILSTFICNISLTAQSNFVLGNQVEQPSTDVWNFIKYGEITPSLYTGTVNVSIPFYTYKDNDFEVPISFDYASNGFIPNTPPGTLGADWILNVGGSIAVEIKGLEDFDDNIHQANNGSSIVENFNYLLKNNYAKATGTFLIDGRFYYDNADHSDCNDWSYTSCCPWQFIPSLPATNIYYCPDNDLAYCCKTIYDAEPDIYHFNFMGYTGTFHRDYDGSVYVYNTNTNNKDFKIEITSSSNTSFIKIITADGYQYSFEPKEYIQKFGIRNTSVYKLTQIIAPNSRWIRFSYQDYKVKNVKPGFLRIEGEYNDCLCTLGYGVDDNIRYRHAVDLSYADIITSVISDITTSEKNEILFQYEDVPLGYYTDSIKRLTGIVVNNRMNEIKKCSLEYKQNPYGTKYTYLAGINISGEGKYIMDYHNWTSTFPPRDTYGLDHWGYYNGGHANTSSNFFYVSTLNNYDDEIINYGHRDSNYASAKYGVLNKITYPTGGYSEFDYESHDFSKAVKRISANSFKPILMNESGICGGVRIKSIKNYLSDNSLASAKEFEYKNENTSSGILLNMPRYRIKYSATYPDRIHEKNMELYSSNLFSYNRANIEYSKVTEKRSDGSKIEYSFTNYSMSRHYEDIIILPFLPIPNRLEISFEGWSINNPKLNNLVNPGKSLQAERGKLYKKDIFNVDASPKLLYSEINSYDTTKILATDALPAHLIKAITHIPVNIENYDLSSTSKIQYLDSVAVGENTSYTYNSHGQIASQTTVDSKGDLIITEFEYVTDLTNPAGIYKNMIDKNVLNYPLEERIYRIKYGTNIKTLIGGRKYTYTQPNVIYKALVRISQIEIYDNVKNAWIADKKYKYDGFGNLLESENRNGVKTSYVWGFDGLHPAAICENTSIDDVISIFNNLSRWPLSGGLTEQTYSALKSISPAVNITRFDYEPFVGLTRITDHSGKITEYNYNNTGKLRSVIDDNNDLRKKYYYSTDH